MKKTTNTRSLWVGVAVTGLFTISLNANAAIKTCADHDTSTIHEKSSKYQELIEKYSRKYRVDADFIKSVITVESCYNPKARSSAGAKGLMQLMPATAKRFGVKDRTDPEQNIHGGVRYLRFLIDRYDADLKKVAAAYNAGEGNVDRHNGIPPYRQTKRYVAEVFKMFGKLYWERPQFQGWKETLPLSP